jgi:hypothetical protein
MPRPKKPVARLPRGGTDTLKERGLVQQVVLFTPEERQAVKVAAARAGLPANEWVRQLAVAAAKNNSE